MAKKITVELNKLYFDPQNPRLPNDLYGSSDELQIIDYMVRNGNIVELMQSIGEAGYSESEPLLIVPKKGEATTYIVVEGNRRLAALKLLSYPEKAKVRKNTILDIVSKANQKPTKIPAILYNTREETLDYLGYRHITGVKDWGALEKARYLDQLYKLHNGDATGDEIYHILAKLIGSRTDYVARLHTALMLYEKANDNAYFGVKIEEENIDFSFLYSALSNSSAISYLGLSTVKDSSLSGLNIKHFEKYFKWLFDPSLRVINESRDISKLNKILESDEATKILDESGTISKALLYTSEPNERFEEAILQAKTWLQDSRDMVTSLKNYPNNINSTIEEIEKLAKSIKGSISEIFKTE